MEEVPLPDIENPFPDDSFLLETALPDDLEKEVEVFEDIEDWPDFGYKLGEASGRDDPDWRKLNNTEFGHVEGELPDIEAQEGEVKKAIRWDYGLMMLLEARIRRREQRLNFIDDVREDYARAWKDKQSERLQQAKPANEGEE